MWTQHFVSLDQIHFIPIENDTGSQLLYSDESLLNMESGKDGIGHQRLVASVSEVFLPGP